MSLLSHSTQSNGSPSQGSQHQASDSLVSDVELLTQFLKLKNESAFAALVERYGQMVFAVSLRIVRDRHSAEDVTQATFLLLAQNAKKIKRREALSSWLHGVAIRLAKKALKRRTREQVSDVVTELEAAEKTFAEIHSTFEQQVLDEELQQLPPQYREPLVLHFLQGKTYEETAQLLGVSIGAIEGRMKRGKRELYLRLTKRGVGLGAVLAALSWSQEAAAATLGPEFVHTITVNGIAAFQGTAFAPGCSPEAVYLAGKEVTMLTMTKIALLTCGLAVATGAGWMTHAGLADDGKGSSAAGGAGIGTVVADSEQSTGGVEVTQAAPSEGSGNSLEGFGGASGGIVGEVSSIDQRRQALRTAIDALRAAEKTINEQQSEGVLVQSVNNQWQRAQVELMRAYEMLAKQQSAKGNQTAGAAMGGRLTPAGMSGMGGGMESMMGMSGQPPQRKVTGDLITVEKNLSPQVEKITKALGEITNVEFPGNPLSDVVDYIGQAHQIPIILDQAGLSNEGISGDDEVQLVLSGVPLRDALDLMLEPLGLTYVIKNGVMMVTTGIKASDTLETRVYDVRSLNVEDPEALSDVITHGISGNWHEKDGDGGEISFFNGSLVIRQTQRSHEEIETLLNQLARQFQSAAENPQWPAKKRPIPVVPGGMGGGGFGGGQGGGQGYF